MSPTRALQLAALFALTGCPAPMVVDSGTPPPEDASVEVDSGTPDAGRPPRDAGTPDAGFTSAPLAQWCGLQALAKCDRDHRCGRLGDAGVAGCLLTNTTVATCDQLAFTRGVAEGRLAYDEGQAVKCLNAYASGSCSLVPPECAVDGLFTGRAVPDAGCLGDLDCNADGFCDLYDDQCPHHCRAWVSMGELCDGFFRRCDPRTAGCDTVTDGGAESRCQPAKDAGSPCSRYDSCPEGMTCTGTGTGPQHCVVRLAAIGQPCGVEGGFPFCDNDSFCRQGPPVNGVRPPGTCQLKAGLGGTCTGPYTCLPSLRCSTLVTTGTCLVKAGFHEGCISYDDCQDGLFCSAQTQRCEQLPTDGGDCSFQTSGYRCAPGHTCSFIANDTCEAWKPAGGDCGYDQQCLSNDCRYSSLPDGGFGGRCVESCSLRADAGF